MPGCCTVSIKKMVIQQWICLPFEEKLLAYTFVNIPYTIKKSVVLVGRILPANRRVSQEVKFDGMNHYRSILPKTKRCAVCGKTTEGMSEM